MKYSVLGSTGIEVSKLCMGTLTVGPVQAALPLEEGAQVLAYAISQGINFFDTAQLYETYPYLREAMALSRNHEIVISSKTYAYTADMAREAVEQARKELDRDYIDIFMLHEQESIHTLRGHREALDVFWDYKEKGIIRAVGASMHHVAAVYGAIDMGLDVVHPLINKEGLGIVDGTREEMEQAIGAAKQAGLGVFAMKALGGGNLFKQAEDCFNYIWDLNSVDSVAVGMQSPQEIDANIGFMETGAFSKNAEGYLKSRRRHLHIDDWCTGCGECARRCGQQALEVVEGMAKCNHSRCVLCGYCSTVCPMWAVKVI